MTAPALNATDDTRSDQRSDGMIALVPADPAALAVAGGDPAEQIHLTLVYLGDQVDQWAPEQADAVQQLGAEIGRWFGPVTARIFAHAIWNVDGGPDGTRTPATVYELTEDSARMIEMLHDELCHGVRDQIGRALFPDQFVPFKPHVTAGYGVPVEALSATGVVLFDRVRVAIGGQVTDYPLTGNEGIAEYSAAKGVQLMTNAITAAAATAAPPLPVDPGGAPQITDGIPVVFPAVVVEGMPTSDGRFIEAGVLEHRALPLPILAQVANPDGGDGHDGAVVIGRLNTLVRLPGPEVIDKETGQPFPEGTFVWQATGEIDPNHPASDLVRRGYLTGNSADLVSVDAEMIFDEPEDGADDFEALFAAPSEIRLHAGVIAATTLVPIPAFASAYIELDGHAVEAAADQPALVASAAWRSHDLGDASCVACTMADEAAQGVDQSGDLRGSVVRAGLTAAATPTLPDAAMFDDPELAELTMPLHIEGPGGRVYGHLAPWDACHIGYPGQCVTPPHSASNYAHFRTGAVLADRDGETVTLATGVLTIGTGHAGGDLGARAAAEHYDNTGTVVADVTAGEDEFGIWVAGRVRADATDAQVAALRAAPPSGDWRNVGGVLELVAALGVNTPGYRPSTRMRVASGAPQSLVAAGWRPVRHEDEVQRLADAVADRLAAMGVISIDQARLDLGQGTLAQRRTAALEALQQLALEQRRAAALQSM